MSIHLYLVRHGATLENERKCFSGWSEARLSPYGTWQAKQLAAYFRYGDRRPASLYCSDLERAVRTAEIIGRPHRLKPERSPLLRELNFGRWEGLTWEQISTAYPQELRTWLEDPFRHPPPRGESLKEMKERTDRFLNDLLQAVPADENCLVVAHGGTIRLWIFRLLSLSRKDFWNLAIDTASVSFLNISAEGPHPIYINKKIADMKP